MAEEVYKLRGDFLEFFVKSLIANSYKPKKDEEFFVEQTQAAVPAKGVIAQPAVKPREAPKVLAPAKVGAMLPARAKPMMKPSTLQISPPPVSKSSYSGGTINLGKIASVLRDPSVFSIEVPGPGKNILVNRGGTMQTSAIMLTKEEIQKIMDNLSEKTRIPILPGLFKAAVQDLLVTAVVSDFVGTRFIVQKRMPFQ